MDAEALANLIVQMRDGGRPDIFEVIRIIKESFVDYDLTQDGPDCWIWSERQLAAAGIPKYYVLSRSLAEGTEGYPVLTIRQAYSVRLDTWLSMSALVIGPDEANIARSIAILIANHLCAFAGVRRCANAVAASQGDPSAGFAVVQEIGKLDVDLDLPEPTFDPNEAN